MEIIIYAAGLGSRLGRNVPKALVEVYGKTLLEYQLISISKVFPDVPVHIIGGYKYSLLNEFVESLHWRPNPVVVHLNPFYECGIIGTAWTSLFVSNDPDVLRIDGDVYFSEEAMKALEKIKTSTLLVSKCENDKTTVKAVADENGRLKRIEHLKNYSGDMEWICIERYLNDDYRKIVEYGVEHLALNAYYFEALNIQCESSVFETRFVKDIYEIDTVNDLNVCTDFLSNRNMIQNG